LLVRGYTRSFIDFFLLTHRLRNIEATATVASPLPAERGGPMFVCEVKQPSEEYVDRMKFMTEHLAESEAAARTGDLKRAAGAFSLLAEHFEKAGQTKSAGSSQHQQALSQHQQPPQTKTAMSVAIHFHEKALANAKQIGDIGLEAAAHRSLGSCRHRTGDIAGAIAHYERFNELAKQPPVDEGMLAMSGKLLIIVYRAMADECEQAHDFGRAAEYYGKYLACAEAVHDAESTGVAHYRLGLCHK
jgi:tetratricopeptide (TPR) repeat protein